MRDLKADLENIKELSGWANGIKADVGREWLDRAIAAEDKLAEVMNEKLWREYDQKCERLKDENAKLTAQVAALQKVVEAAKKYGIARIEYEKNLELYNKDLDCATGFIYSISEAHENLLQALAAWEED